jgi:hypothetical protein
MAPVYSKNYYESAPSLTFPYAPVNRASTASTARKVSTTAQSTSRRAPALAKRPAPVRREPALVTIPASLLKHLTLNQIQQRQPLPASSSKGKPSEAVGGTRRSTRGSLIQQSSSGSRQGNVSRLQQPSKPSRATATAVTVRGQRYRP